MNPTAPKFRARLSGTVGMAAWLVAGLLAPSWRPVDTSEAFDGTAYQTGTVNFTAIFPAGPATIRFLDNATGTAPAYNAVLDNVTLQEVTPEPATPGVRGRSGRRGSVAGAATDPALDMRGYFLSRFPAESPCIRF